nr:MAG TPA: hypothetical protein [Bacteriophage sp.]
MTMTYNEARVDKYCEKLLNKYGCKDCVNHCELASLCHSCYGDFSKSDADGVPFADKAVETVERCNADDIANSVLAEYYKKQLEAANEEIETLKEMNKVLAESIKNLTEKGVTL